MLSFIKNIGPTEWIIIALIIVIFFGAKIAQRLGKASGETYRELKNVKKTFTDAVEDKDEKSK